MYQQLRRKQRKLLRGIIRTYIRHEGEPYKASEWWDEDFYDQEISDAATIARSRSSVAAMYHYASVELLILRHFGRFDIDPSGPVFDVGSGAGHWIRFYKQLGASSCDGVDVSSKCVTAMQAEFADDPAVTIHHGLCDEVLETLNKQFDIINAIGVMFHIVDDDEWTHTIRCIGKRLNPGGVFIVGGHFGVFDNVNVQIDERGRCNKRLRSIFRWRRILGDAGFTSIRRYQNSAYLSISEPLPENNVLIATKGA